MLKGDLFFFKIKLSVVGRGAKFGGHLLFKILLFSFRKTKIIFLQKRERK